MDNHTEEQRSYNMSRIRSKWTAIERKVHNMLKGRRIPHKMHPSIRGSPDLVLKEKKVAIFIHGCFWHRCQKCYQEPKSKKEYWLAKIEKNVLRDRKNEVVLKKSGWSVLVFWEHQIKQEFPRVLERILSA